MNTSIKKTLFVALIAIFSLSCSKDNTPTRNQPTTLKTDVLVNIANNVCAASYNDMYAKAQELQAAITDLNSNPTDAKLATARTKWKAMRTTWEQSEAWLFGPVESENIDPRIDTWPVDFNALEAILNGTHELNEAYVDGLDDALKGFHPIEYLLWGQNGNKTAAEFDQRQKDFLAALTQNLVKLTQEVNDQWANGYKNQLANAGNNSSEFATQQAAYLQIAEAMAGICGEVADAKLKEPFEAQDPTLEESPFAKNSIVDFTNNIEGVLAIYQGRFGTKDGLGLEDVMRANNLSLDAELKTKHAAAIAALKAIDKPFGEAIVHQQSKVQNAMDKVGELATLIETKVKPFIAQYTN